MDSVKKFRTKKKYKGAKLTDLSQEKHHLLRIHSPTPTRYALHFQSKGSSSYADSNGPDLGTMVWTFQKWPCLSKHYRGSFESSRKGWTFPIALEIVFSSSRSHNEKLKQTAQLHNTDTLPVRVRSSLNPSTFQIFTVWSDEVVAKYLQQNVHQQVPVNNYICWVRKLLTCGPLLWTSTKYAENQSLCEYNHKMHQWKTPRR
jgi:hypothetical protein